MIHEQDYLLRQVKKLADFLVQIITKKKSGEYDEAKSLATTAIGELLDEPDQDIVNLSLKETYDVFNDKVKKGELILTVANILYERIELLDKEEKANHCSFQALLLYKLATINSDTAFPIEDIYKMNTLQKQLEDLPKFDAIEEIIKKKK